ncbi:AlkA N-terminal domain-containing protein [Haloechinothrix sp. LS1_15]|uniref:DNA-3-methyladenine glycosylase 2 family protein n=1 Tax=Haloechinothrix sp. LS1_15 TaxID=2652248 RepID=UPI002945CA78|nr:AlkA N-terminal domain-containing protein [Haloechinothrix sp. LS1_15]MDV6011544.1 DNA-3-methyladenine glycosylase 2 family protein [Haloechinothrix sp. LS1_15]
MTTKEAWSAGEAGLWRDFNRCYAVVTGRDSRFDGQFVTAVRTTGIYCRPSCPALTPRPPNVRFYPTAAAAQRDGYRACRRCLPDAVPGSPEWDLRADLVGRAMRLIADGVVDREGVDGLARRVGYSSRQLGRVLTTELGAGPLALARAHRAHAARVLIQHSALPMADVAFGAGFSSVRQFNETIREVFGLPPSRLRAARAAGQTGRTPEPGQTPHGGVQLRLRLPVRLPFDADGLLGYLAARAVAGVEAVTTSASGDPASYARTLRLPHGVGSAHLEPATDHVRCALRLTDVRDLTSAVTRLRRLLDADADPVAIDAVLAADGVLAAAVGAAPGIRVPGTVDPAELLIRALLGQQISVAAARTAAGRLARELGTPLRWHAAGRDGRDGRDGGAAAAADNVDATANVGTTEPDLLFPSSEMIAEGGAGVLRGPRARTEAILTTAEQLATGRIDLHVGCDPDTLRAQLCEIPGIGRWTADYVTLRALGAPDVLPVTDRALRAGATTLGLSATATALTEHARRWRPWRSYAGMHLWRAHAATGRTTTKASAA